MRGVTAHGRAPLAGALVYDDERSAFVWADRGDVESAAEALPLSRFIPSDFTEPLRHHGVHALAIDPAALSLLAPGIVSEVQAVLDRHGRLRMVPTLGHQTSAVALVSSYRFRFRCGFFVSYGRAGSGTVRARRRPRAHNHFRFPIGSRLYRFGTGAEPANCRKYALSRPFNLPNDLVCRRLRMRLEVLENVTREPFIRGVVVRPIVHDQLVIGAPIGEPGLLSFP